MQILIHKSALLDWFFCFRTRHNCIEEALSLRLLRRKVFGMHVRNDCCISCHSGCVWVTDGRDHCDILLRVGESIHLRTRGKLVLEAIDDSAVSIRLIGQKTKST